MELSILHAAREVPDRIGLIADGVPRTYRELGAQTLGAIGWLEARGIRVRDDRRVAVVATSTPNTLAILWALLELGVTVVLVHPKLTERERSFLIEDSTPALVVYDADEELDPREPALREYPGGDDEATLAIVYTSGSSGRPKGVELTRGAFRAAARASAENLVWEPDDRWLLCMPQGHVGGFSIVVRCLSARRCVVIPSSTQHLRPFDSELILQTIDRDRVSLVSFVPTMLAKIVEGEARALSRVRAILLGGAAAPPELLRTMAHRRLPALTTYGLTEACSQVTTQPYGTSPDPAHGAGLPLPGVELAIVGGVVHVRGPAIMRGYFPRGAHKQPFVALEGRDGSWLETGDLGRIDEHGRLHIVGRSSDLIITGGENVHPTEIERALETAPGVAAACVFGVPDPRWGEIVAAALVSAPGARPPFAAVKAHLATVLASHKHPRRMAWVKQLNLNSMGKIDRKATAAETIPELQIVS